ncbi:FecR family protein [Desulfosudis oleivorans]|uniref:FecR family protein n=1 Tax=Desulfosudis oleivorans TaxID=181663 RepID=UPI001427B19A|nr:FecR family protein [Desulfosudis oleivorans]
MGNRTTGLWSVLLGVTLLCCMSSATVFAAADIPDNLVIQKHYRQGMGESVGSVETARGQAFIMHTDRKYGYEAKKGLPLYNGDTLFTRSPGAMTIVLKDNSKMALAADTSLVINKSIYDPAGKSRMSFVSMLAGKARFLVTKLSDYRHSRFNVKTGSSVVGVRGSDFIIEQVGDKIIISCLDNTVLEVFNPDFPLDEPVIVESFQQLVAAIGQLPGNPIDVSPEELKKLVKDLGLSGDDDDDDNDGDSGTGDGDEEGDDDDDGEGDPLLNPDLLENPEGEGAWGDDGYPLDDLPGIIEDIEKNVIQDEVTEPLPDMPNHPSL